jgi:peptidoglycan hydrolase CwlO-like protein|tara:strand:- start:338 stop:526 length:189 start_codon:yes stop_codon:yes gene_type:complete
MKVYKDDRGEHDLERKIEQLQLKIRIYERLIKENKSKLLELESELAEKDVLIRGLKQIVEDK